MPKSSEDYWREREEEQRRHNITDEKEYEKRIKKIYKYMISEASDRIYAFYSKYAIQDGISMAEAKKRANKLDIEAYQKLAKEYVDTKDMSDEANEAMSLYNMTMKVNRLELLKANIGLDLVKGHDEFQKFMDKELEGKTVKELERLSGILGQSINDNKKLANSIVNASFHNATFSDRIWANQAKLKAELDRLLTSGMIAGVSSRKLASDLAKRLDVSQSNALRLMTTELRRTQTEAARQSYIENGITQYKFMTANPKGPCSVCKAIDGEIYNVEDMEPGLNAPPMHPWCHCTTAPYRDRKLFNEYINDRSADGMTFKEWSDRRKRQSHYTGKLLSDSKGKRIYKTNRLHSTDEIEPYFRKITFLTSDDKLKTFIQNEMTYMPFKDLDILKKKAPIVIKTNSNSFYWGFGPIRVIAINKKLNHGSFAHEFAHFALKGNQFNDELINCLYNVYKQGTKISIRRFSKGDYVTIESDLFVSIYQGRTYISKEQFENGKTDIRPQDLKEYPSVGYQTFITNPELLYIKDKKLFDFFKNGGLAK